MAGGMPVRSARSSLSAARVHRSLFNSFLILLRNDVSVSCESRLTRKRKKSCAMKSSQASKAVATLVCAFVYDKKSNRPTQPAGRAPRTVSNIGVESPNQPVGKVAFILWSISDWLYIILTVSHTRELECPGK